MAGMNRGMNNFVGRGQGAGMGQGSGVSHGAGMGQGNGQGRGHGYGKNRSNHMDFSDTDDLSQLIHGCSHYLKQSEMNNLGGTQQKILNILDEAGDLTQRELMEILHVKAGSLSELIKKLESKDLVAKLANPHDRRSMLIRITEAGKLQISHCNDGECQCNFSALDDDKKDQLRSLLKELLDSWYR